MPGNSFKDRKLASEAGKKHAGKKHPKTQQWERLGEYITGNLTERMLDYIAGLPDDKAFEAYKQLLNYFKPQLSRSEQKHDFGEDIKAHILKAFDDGQEV